MGASPLQASPLQASQLQTSPLQAGFTNKAIQSMIPNGWQANKMNIKEQQELLDEAHALHTSNNRSHTLSELMGNGEDATARNWMAKDGLFDREGVITEKGMQALTSSPIRNHPRYQLKRELDLVQETLNKERSCRVALEVKLEAVDATTYKPDPIAKDGDKERTRHTGRDLELLKNRAMELRRNGLTNKGIAKEVGKSVRTVRLWIGVIRSNKD